MALERTYTKRGDKVYLREIDMRADVDGNMFKVRDIEVEYDYKKHLPQIGRQLTELQTEIADLQGEEARLLAIIAAIEAAVKDTVKGTRG